MDNLLRSEIYNQHDLELSNQAYLILIWVLAPFKSFKDLKGAKTLNEKLRKTCYNYKPDLIILGHADLISAQQISELREDYQIQDLDNGF